MLWCAGLMMCARYFASVRGAIIYNNVATYGMDPLSGYHIYYEDVPAVWC